MIDKYIELISFLGHNLIQGIFISLLLIILVKLLSRNKIETALSSQIIRWTIIIYSIGAIISSLVILIFFEQTEKYAFMNRITGPYWWSYLLMFIFNSFLPLILLNNKMGKKNSIILIIALLMNIGWLFESFIIHITSMHSDYITEDYNPYLPNAREVAIITKSFFIGLFLLIFENGLKVLKRTK